MDKVYVVKRSNDFTFDHVPITTNQYFKSMNSAVKYLKNLGCELRYGRYYKAPFEYWVDTYDLQD